jgi:hypothetical protein
MKLIDRLLEKMRCPAIKRLEKHVVIDLPIQFSLLSVLDLLEL